MTPDVVVRGNRALIAVVISAALVSVGYLWAAMLNGGGSWWLVAALMAGLAGMSGWVLLDARTPLLVADEIGIRLRTGRQWRGLPWPSVRVVTVKTPHGLHDGAILVEPRDSADVFSIPMTLTHTCTSRHPAQDLAALAAASVEVRAAEVDAEGDWLFERFGSE